MTDPSTARPTLEFKSRTYEKVTTEYIYADDSESAGYTETVNATFAVLNAPVEVMPGYRRTGRRHAIHTLDVEFIRSNRSLDWYEGYRTRAIGTGVKKDDSEGAETFVEYGFPEWLKELTETVALAWVKQAYPTTASNA